MSKPLTLEQHYAQVNSIILDRQHPITGLLPASTAVTVHGDYRDAWVRDNVYSIIAVWSLALAYRRAGTDPATTYELEQSCIRLMRGLLRSMMQQSNKVEYFKKSLALHDALHAKYDTQTGGTVVADHEWGHLQIDATSLFLLTLAQMISSGLDIISSRDEIDFIQNLVYYIERAYRIPDYGIWERGEKTNIGYVELNASSIGMAKAALQALSGFNLYGKKGNKSTMIHVIPDNIAMAEITLRSMLPRESSTKETDSALLGIIGYPAFAIDDQELILKVREEIRSKLGGNYGYKRFLRDGHQTVVEDIHRHYYNPEELKAFENIESEWPLFYAFELLLALFQENDADVQQFYRKLTDVMVSQHGSELIPELYYVPEEHIDAERQYPGTQQRKPNKNIPLVWAQSLFVLGTLLKDGYLKLDDIDPLGLHYIINRRPPRLQVLALAENQLLKSKLATYGIQAQTPDDLEDTAVILPQDLSDIFSVVGANEKLNMTGRSPRRLKSLATSSLFNINGKQAICVSLFFLQKEFYLGFDNDFLISRFKSELGYIHQYWNQPGIPLVTVLLTDYMVTRSDKLVSFLERIQRGELPDLPVELSTFDALSGETSIITVDAPEVSLIERQLTNDQQYIYHLKSGLIHSPLDSEEELSIEIINDIPTLETLLTTAENIYEQIEILNQIVNLGGLDQPVQLNGSSVLARNLVEEIYKKAGERGYWSAIRLASAILKKVDINLQNSVNLLLARQKIIQVGKAFSDESMIIRPLPFSELMSKIDRFCRDDHRDQVFTQEILIYVGILNKAKPELFKDLLTIRISYIILLLTANVAWEQQVSQEEALDMLMDMAPSAVERLLEKVIVEYQESSIQVKNLESLRIRERGDGISWVNDLRQRKTPPKEGWLSWRKSTGTLSRLSNNFFTNIWHLLEHCRGIIIGDKLEKRNRLNSAQILSDMTPGEKAFHLRVEHLLNKISAPEYRQLTLEAMKVAASFSTQNPDLFVDDYVVFDVINGHAVRLAFLDRHPELSETYHDHKADAWTMFYNLAPDQTTYFIIEAFKFLLEYEPQNTEGTMV